ncbi:prepilin-type N-terminal cleavage/methylation domain-containing protein [Puniceicoccus vermicola]|uniref:Prepilin-type N-terminal cleavage/methylation domain-containing protein n=1 Tax=Puniceicoccus vermicola TaxID=388746 RepID=A0A7X1AX63_9BACT|nr:prepilin-type N-terminal cleavage/methylation domain-containing protein [Puniceicoccus vermicola]MBC2601502.1 prepilin-type N-terminal cleavage/methylation domain-containing protein [Puniceicoccus vermicola]
MFRTPLEASQRQIPKALCGFTLVELITAIAVLGILTAILIPSLSSVRRRAETAECASNMRQLYSAIVQQAQDNGGRFVMANNNTTGVRWFQGELNRAGKGKSELSPFAGGGDTLQRLSVCPLNLTDEPVAYPRNDYGYPYVVNYHVLAHSGADRRTSLYEMEDPSRVVMMTDSNKGPDWGNSGFGESTNPSWSRIAEPHGGKTNVLWCDGHVTLQPKSEIEENTQLLSD